MSATVIFFGFVADLLLEGKTAALRQQLKEMAQTGDDVLPDRIVEYERKTGYEPELDTSLLEDRAMLVRLPEQRDGRLTGEIVKSPKGSSHGYVGGANEGRRIRAAP